MTSHTSRLNASRAPTTGGPGQDRPDDPDHRRLSLRRTEEVVAAVSEVTARLADLGYADKEVFAVHLALEEALVNAIRHGHRGDPGKRVAVTYDADPRRVVIEVEDEGPGFDPDAVPDPLAPENLERDCGRGLLLIKSYMDSVEFNDKGNRITLRKAKTAPAANGGG